MNFNVSTTYFNFHPVYLSAKGWSEHQIFHADLFLASISILDRAVHLSVMGQNSSLSLFNRYIPY
jgi:hypothetical protein